MSEDDHPSDSVGVHDLLDLLDGLDDHEVTELVADLPESVVNSLLAGMTTDETAVSVPATPAAQATELDPAYRERAHLTYLSDRLARAVTDVEGGQTRYLRVSMPPRSGTSLLISVYLLIWLLRKHPDWKVGLISHSPSLAVSWGRQVRRVIEEHGPSLRLALAKDAGAAAEWQTTEGGGVVSRSAPGQSITGLGFKVLIADDVTKDFASAHSETQRDALWDWWRANATTRLEPPALVLVVGTRWHELDLIGRLGSSEYDGDPGDWEVIEFPAIAETDDVLGRAPGEPLMSPLIEETREEALARWESVRVAVGPYAWAALYQQSPAPAKGAIFDVGWWRYWTLDPDKVTDDGRVVLLPELVAAGGGRWLDSWDCSFKDTKASDYVVGQRWVRWGPFRYLIWQDRDRRSFTSTVEVMKRWADPAADASVGGAPFSLAVHERLVEDKANGTAVIDVLKASISGMVPINPTDSKEGRARAVTPECASGHVLLPLPSDPGNEWVADLLGELRSFPTGSHDDQVDSLTQALMRLRDPGRGSVTVPGRVAKLPVARRGQTALATGRRYGSVGGPRG